MPIDQCRNLDPAMLPVEIKTATELLQNIFPTHFDRYVAHSGGVPKQAWSLMMSLTPHQNTCFNKFLDNLPPTLRTSFKQLESDIQNAGALPRFSEPDINDLNIHSKEDGIITDSELMTYAMTHRDRIKDPNQFIASAYAITDLLPGYLAEPEYTQAQQEVLMSKSAQYKTPNLFGLPIEQIGREIENLAPEDLALINQILEQSEDPVASVYVQPFTTEEIFELHKNMNREALVFGSTQIVSDPDGVHRDNQVAFILETQIERAVKGQLTPHEVRALRAWLNLMRRKYEADNRLEAQVQFAGNIVTPYSILSIATLIMTSVIFTKVWIQNPFMKRFQKICGPNANAKEAWRDFHDFQMQLFASRWKEFLIGKPAKFTIRLLELFSFLGIAYGRSKALDGIGLTHTDYEKSRLATDFTSDIALSIGYMMAEELIHSKRKHGINDFVIPPICLKYQPIRVTVPEKAPEKVPVQEAERVRVPLELLFPWAAIKGALGAIDDEMQITSETAHDFWADAAPVVVTATLLAGMAWFTKGMSLQTTTSGVTLTTQPAQSGELQGYY